jgi:hypothetical protein
VGYGQPHCLSRAAARILIAIYRSQKSAREYALSGEKRGENKERINPTEDFLRRNTCKKLVRSGIA